jgi:hypothetical protein
MVGFSNTLEFRVLFWSPEDPVATSIQFKRAFEIARCFITIFLYKASFMARKSESKASKKSSPPQPVAVAKEKQIEAVDGVDTEDAAPLETNTVTGLLQVTLSGALFQRLKAQAEEEGIGLEEYARELLSESVTMRAFEIIEKRFQMRGGNPNQGNNMNRHNSGNHGQPNNNHNNQHRHGGRRDNRRGGMSHQRYQNIMDDKASFLEYVRSQERQHR